MKLLDAEYNACIVVMSTHTLCKKYGQLQMDFVSVERVVELLHLEPEPPGDIEPPASWPSYTGDIVCENVTVRYASHLDPSLADVSFRIPGGSTAALLGRTGRLLSIIGCRGSLSSSRLWKKYFSACTPSYKYMVPPVLFGAD